MNMHTETDAWAPSKAKGKTIYGTSIKSKFPPYGKALAIRQRSNRPTLIIVCTGRDAWKRAKNWQRHSEFAAVVFTGEQPPNELIWTVSECPILVEWMGDVTRDLIVELVKALLNANALFVSVQPLFIDGNSWIDRCDEATMTYKQIRETRRTYYRGAK
ncbi:MAG: hypothetical protein WCP01_03730 [Methylococcaceae bacterium]